MCDARERNAEIYRKRENAAYTLAANIRWAGQRIRCEHFCAVAAFCPQYADYAEDKLKGAVVEIDGGGMLPSSGSLGQVDGRHVGTM